MGRTIPFVDWWIALGKSSTWEQAPTLHYLIIEREGCIKLVKGILKSNIKLITIGDIKKNEQLKGKVSKIIEGNERELPGLLQGWDTRVDAYKLYVIFNKDEPVGLIGWTGPPDAADPGYWIHRNYRNKRVGTTAVELLAQEMRNQGVKKLKDDVIIDTKTEGERVASKKLVRYLRELLSKSPKTNGY